MSVQIGHMPRAGDADQAVGADAEMTVAQLDDVLLLWRVFPTAVGIHHEIVAGALRLDHMFWQTHTAHSTATEAEMCIYV